MSPDAKPAIKAGSLSNSLMFIANGC